ncbi:MAG TPA: alkaline phosphatase family protein [Acidimicrobiia bacterium]|jgi:phospholipase C
MTRRSFLAASAVAAAAAACSSSSSKSSGTTRVSGGSPTTGGATTTTLPTHRQRVPGELWDPSKPAGTDLLPQIEHIIVVMQENHSFDNYFGMLGRGDGFTLDASGKPTNTCLDASGKPVRAFPMANTCPVNNPSQNWDASHEQWNNGKMDGFVKSPSGVGSMGYWDGTHLPFYYSMAKTFPLCDRWFCSVMAQTYPNRHFLLAGTARGDITTSIGTLADPLPPNGTIMQALDKHSIPWIDYYTDVPSVGLYLSYATAHADRLRTAEQHFYADAAAGKLPPFCLVEPNFGKQSEENPQDISVGEEFSSRVINAVMQSPTWSKTVLLFCYDEHGGYYDHVPPPAAPEPDGKGPNLQAGDVPGAYNRLGFRVPAVIVSPYAKKDYVSHVVHDHTSVLALVEHKFNLPALTHRDGWADDLLDSLDFDNPGFMTPPTLAAPLNHTARDDQGVAQNICTFPSPIPAGV